MKLILLVPMMFAVTLATAQIKKQTNFKKTSEMNIQTTKVDNKTIKVDKSYIKPDKSVNALGLSKYNVYSLYPEMTTTLDGSKISTRIIPSDVVQATSSVKNSKPKEKGTTEEEGLICKNYSVSLSPESESFDAPLDKKMTFTYPGAAYNYNDYVTNSAQPRHNQSERNPIILQVSSASATGKQILVNDPTSNNLIETAGQLKYSLPSQANNLTTEIYVKTIVNNASFALNVSAGGGGFGFNVNAKLGISYASNKTYMSIDANQKNYVITANRPDRAEGGFYKDEAENLKNENVYMSSVTYGRRVIGVIETELDEQNMAVGLEASYKGFGASANLGLGIIDKMSSGKTSVRLLFIGGKGDVITIPNPTEASVKAVIDQWMSDTNAQAAVPIEYTFKNMRDVGMRWESVASNITYKQCVPKPPAAVDTRNILWKITLNLTGISNETDQQESIHLAAHQDAFLYGTENPIGAIEKNKFNLTSTTLINWGFPSPMDVNEEPRTFSRSTNPEKSLTWIIPQYDLENDAYLEVVSSYIAMVSTRIGGQTNDNATSYKLKIPLKDIIADYMINKTLSINLNNRVFKFDYRVTKTEL